ncbi:hypothetical protein CUC43_11295 [Bacillus thuringiensis LM1212]|nr:hypothetical protein CUC43_11295 [Bacillus thuringiensis LM1212]QDF27030.1 hypothetical protein FJR70_23675 [Bacillus tropicus]
MPVSEKGNRHPFECLCGKIYVSILLSPHNLWAFFIDKKSVFCRKKKREQNTLLPQLVKLCKILPLSIGKLFF